MPQFGETQASNQTRPSFEGNGHHAQDQSMAEQARDQIEHAANTAVTTAKEYPIATLALAVGVAFAVGALWKAGRSRPSRWDLLQSRLPDIPSAQQLKSYWR